MRTLWNLPFSGRNGDTERLSRFPQAAQHRQLWGLNKIMSVKCFTLTWHTVGALQVFIKNRQSLGPRQTFRGRSHLHQLLGARGLFTPPYSQQPGRKFLGSHCFSLFCSGMLARLVPPNLGSSSVGCIWWLGRLCPGCVTHEGSVAVRQGIWLEICRQQIIIKKGFGVEALCTKRSSSAEFRTASAKKGAPFWDTQILRPS